MTGRSRVTIDRRALGTFLRAAAETPADPRARYHPEERRITVVPTRMRFDETEKPEEGVE